MTIPLPPNPDLTDAMDYVVMSPPPNDNTDGGECVCGHAKADHQPSNQQDPKQPAAQCQHCGCTRAYAAWIPSNS